MAYGLIYSVEHRTNLPGGDRWARIEVLERDFAGTAQQKEGVGDTWALEYEPVDRQQLLDGFIQKGRLSLDIVLDRDELKRIATGDDKQFQMRLLLDGDVKVTVFLTPDETQIFSSDHPSHGRLVGKDFSILENTDYATFSTDSNKRYIRTLADILSDTGFGLGIHTYNDWTANNLSAADDYFNQAYVNEFHLQDFSSFQEGSYAPITKFKALEELVPPGYVLRQWDNVWNLIDLSHLAKDEGSVKRWEYDSAGTQTGSTDPVDLVFTLDGDSSFFNNPQEQPWPGIKSLELDFNHKTSFQHILYEQQYTHALNDISVETIKVVDGEKRIVKISGQVEVDTDTNPGSLRTGEADILIQIEDLELSLSDGSWATGNGAQTVSVSGSDNTLTGSFSRTSDAIPTGGANNVDESTLKVEMRFATVTGETVQEVRWKNMATRITNGNQVANDATQNFRLKQSGEYSVRRQIKQIIFGQGPSEVQTALSRSAIRYLDLGVFKALTDFKHDGGSAAAYHRFVLDNILNMQRVHTEAMDTDLIALWSPLQIIKSEDKFWFFSGGQINGSGEGWPIRVVELNWNTAGDDTLTEFFTVGAGDAGTTVPVQSGSETAIGTDVQAWDANLDQIAALSPADGNFIVGNGTEWIAESGNTARTSLGLGTGDSPTFAGANFTGLVDLNGPTAGGIQDSFLTIVGDNWFNINSADGFGRLNWFLYGDAGSWKYAHATLEGMSIRGGDDLRIYFGDSNTGGVGSAATITQKFLLSKQGLAVNTSSFSATETLRNVGDTRLEGDLIFGTDGTVLFVDLFGRDVFDHDGIRIRSTDESGALINKINFSTRASAAGANEARITFLNANRYIFEDGGVEITGGTLDVSDDTTLSGALTVALDATFNNDVFVAGGLFAKEFLVDVTRVQFDNAMAPGGGVIATVTGSAGSETITFEDENGTNIVPLAADDIIHIQLRTGLTTGTVVKNIWRKVSSITGNDITLTDTGITWATGTDDVGSIEVGDHVVVKGNTTDATRDHYIKFQISGIDVPTIFGFDSVTDVNDSGTKKYVIGDMSEAPTLSNGTVPSGVGFFSDNAFLEGTIIATTGEIGGWTLAASKLTGGNVAGEFTGMQSGAGTTKAFFCGSQDANGTAPADGNWFFAQSDGNIFHPAIGGQVERFSSSASFGRNPADASTPADSNNWSAYIFRAATGTSTRQVEAKRFFLRKRFGIENILLKGRAKTVINDGGLNANTNHLSTIIIEVNPDSSAAITSSEIISSSTFTDFTTEIDISGVADNDGMEITIIVKAEVEVIDNPDSDTIETETFLSEKMSLDQTT